MDILKKVYALLSARMQKSFILVNIVLIISALAAANLIASLGPVMAYITETSSGANSSDTLLKTIIGQKFLVDINDYIIYAAISLAVSTVLQVVRNWAIVNFGVMTSYDISARVLSKNLSAEYTEFKNKSASEHAAIVLNETLEISNRFFRPFCELLGSILTTSCILAVLIISSGFKIIIPLLLIGILFLIITLISSKIGRSLGEIRSRLVLRKYESALDALIGYIEINVLNKKTYFLERYKKPALLFSKTVIKIDLVSKIPQVVLQAMMFSGILFFSYLSTKTTQVLKLDDLSLLAVALVRLVPELNKIFGSTVYLFSATEAVVKVYDILENRVYQPSDDSCSAKEEFENEHTTALLKITNLNFKFDTNRHLFQIKNLNIHAGEKLGIIGESGVGKSTFLSLICGVISIPQGASIVSRDASFSESDFLKLDQKIAYVAQDTFIFEGSIYSNIAFGVPDEKIDKHKVYAAAKSALIYDTIENDFENKFQTVIGRNSSRLSGGQRQRIGIARALYQGAKLIVMDEPTSALDEGAEDKFIEILKTFPSDTTLIMVTHRLKLLNACDRVLEFKDSKVYENRKCI